MRNEFLYHDVDLSTSRSSPIGIRRELQPCHDGFLSCISAKNYGISLCP